MEGHLQQPLGNPSAGEKCGSRSVLLEGTSGGEKPQGSQRKGNGDPTLQRSFIQPCLILNLTACGNFGVIGRAPLKEHLAILKVVTSPFKGAFSRVGLAFAEVDPGEKCDWCY